MTFTIIVNFKHYKQASGPRSEDLLRNLITCRKKPETSVLFAVGPSDLRNAITIAPGRIIAQSVDTVSMGAFTGSLSAEFLQQVGISGSLLNHSEKRVDRIIISRLLEGAKEMGFPLYICAESLDEVRSFSEMKPDFIAYEPPELIGGDVSVSSAKPGIISEASDICRKSNVKLLVGAGVKNADDVRRSRQLGAQGVLIASGIVLSRDPATALNSLIEAA